MTVVINHHIVVTDEEQLMIVNALAFFHLFFKYTADGHRNQIIADWQDVADDSEVNQFDSLATKIAEDIKMNDYIPDQTQGSIQLVPIDYQALYSILARRMTAMHTAKVYIDQEDTFAFRIAIEGDLDPSIKLIKVVEKMQTALQIVDPQEHN